MEKFVLQTQYKGYNFRSRTEARWAVFFDALGVSYEYEPEGFILPNGEWYLPDFYLPVFGGGGYFEVKPLVENKKEWLLKLELLSGITGKCTFILNGPPDFRYYGKYETYLFETCDCDFLSENECKCVKRMVPVGWEAVIFCGGDSNYEYEGGYYVDPEDTIGKPLGRYGMEDANPNEVFWDKYISAVNKSRSARF